MMPAGTARLAGLAAALTLVLTGCGSHGSSQQQSAGSSTTFATKSAHGIKLTDGWVSAAAGMGDMSGMSGMDMSGAEATAYATLTDTGATSDALVSVSTPAAAKATLHNTVSSSDGSAGTMVGTAAIAVPAGGHVTLAPGGYHVMLQGLKSDLKVGTKITMTWTFRSGATLTTSFPVINPADRPQGGQ